MRIEYINRIRYRDNKSTPTFNAKDDLLTSPQCSAVDLDINVMITWLTFMFH